MAVYSCESTVSMKIQGYMVNNRKKIYTFHNPAGDKKRSYA